MDDDEDEFETHCRRCGYPILEEERIHGPGGILVCRKCVKITNMLIEVTANRGTINPPPSHRPR